MRLPGQLDKVSAQRSDGDANAAYSVARNDNLTRLAQRFGTTVAELLRLNPALGGNPNLLREGFRLRLPTPTPSAESFTSPRGVAQPDAALASAPAADVAPAPSAASAVADVVEASGPVSSPRLAAPKQPAGVGEELLRSLDKELTRVLLRPREVEQRVELGDIGKVDLKFEGRVSPSSSFDTTRATFIEAAEKAGHRAVYVETVGRIEGSVADATKSTRDDGTTRPTTAGASAKALATFTLVRGHTFDKNSTNHTKLVSDIVKKGTQPPLSAADAVKLEPGAELHLRLQGELAANVDHDSTSVEAQPVLDQDGVNVPVVAPREPVKTSARLKVVSQGDMSVDLTFKGKGIVEVAVDKSSNNSGDASVQQGDSSLTLGAKGSRGTQRSLSARYELNLNTPSGKKAYDAIVKGDVKTVDALVDEQLAAEELASKDAEAVARLKDAAAKDGAEGQKPAAASDAEAEAEAEPVGVKRTSRFGAVIRDRSSRVDGTGAINGIAQQDATTKGVLSVQAHQRTRTSHDIADGSREVMREIGAGVDLSTPVGENASLGLVASAERTVTYRLPKDVAEPEQPPTDADKALALQNGVRATFVGVGTMGATTKAKRTDTEGDNSTTRSIELGFSRDGDVRVDVERGEDKKVEVSVSVSQKVVRNVEAGSRRSLQAGKVSLGLSGSDKRTRSKEESATLKLDLEDPKHRAAYNAAIRGDLGPARELGPKVVQGEKFWERETHVDVSVSRDKFDAGFAWRRHAVPANDFRIKFDDARKALVDERKAAGKETQWVELSGRLSPSLRAEFGAVGKFGFDASAEMSASAFVPTGAGLPDANLVTPQLVFDPKEALAMPKGAEVTVAGSARIATRAGVGQGASVTTGIATVTADVSLTHNQTWVDDKIEIKVKRLEDDVVELSMDKQTASSTGWSAQAGVSASLDLAAVPGAAAAARAATVAGAISGGDNQVSQLASRLSRKLGIGVQASSDGRESSNSSISTRLRLDTPEAQDAYRAFLRGDPAPVLALADADDDKEAKAKVAAEAAAAAEKTAAEESARADKAALEAAAASAGADVPPVALDVKPAKPTPVEGDDDFVGPPQPAVSLPRASRATIERRSSTDEVREGPRASLSVGEDTNFMREAMRSSRVSVDQYRGGKKTTKELESFFAERSGLFSKGKLTVEAVRVHRTGEDETRQFFLVNFNGTDSWSGKRSVQELVRLGESLGATPVRAMKVEEDAERGVLRKVVGRHAAHGSTETDLQLFVTQKGIADLRTRPEHAGTAAYADWLEQSDSHRPHWAHPDDAKRARARELIGDWQRANDAQNQVAADAARGSFWYEFRSNIWEDAGTLGTATAIEGALKRMRESDNPLAWNRAFADLGRHVDLDMTGTIAAINTLVGKDQLLVHSFKVKGRSVDIEMKDEGTVDSAPAPARFVDH